ncbi:MAG: hypothetical protein HY670_11090 [Chloroflexi bacterium]|nr:hypothetical protein [Chloroflexota bacterium]
MSVEVAKATEDRWVRSICGMCYGNCSIRVHVVNGVAVALEGDPEFNVWGERRHLRQGHFGPANPV